MCLVNRQAPGLVPSLDRRTLGRRGGERGGKRQSVAGAKGDPRRRGPRVPHTTQSDAIFGSAAMERHALVRGAGLAQGRRGARYRMNLNAAGVLVCQPLRLSKTGTSTPYASQTRTMTSVPRHNAAKDELKNASGLLTARSQRPGYRQRNLPGHDCRLFCGRHLGVAGRSGATVRICDG